MCIELNKLDYMPKKYSILKHKLEQGISDEILIEIEEAKVTQDVRMAGIVLESLAQGYIDCKTRSTLTKMENYPSKTSVNEILKACLRILGREHD